MHTNDRREPASRLSLCWLAALGPLALAAAVLWGCAGPAAANEVARSDASRAAGSASDAVQAASAANAFGFDLFKAITPADQNEVFSPTSISLALAMARAGAAGETAAQMDAITHGIYGAGGGNGLNSLGQALASLSGSYRDATGTQQAVNLRVANAPFAQRGMTLQPPYLNALAGKFDAGLRLVDFAGDPNGSLALINGWVDDQTEGRIPHILDRLGRSTRLLLADAIYLKAPWQAAFWPEATKDSPFTRLDGSQTTVPIMSLDLGLATYAAGPGWQAAELGYLGGSLAMTVILPDELPVFEKKLDASLFDQITGALKRTPGDLTFPRFKTETRIDLSTTVSGMGMPSAFGADADFSGITVQESLFISEVMHQANISVDEKGTEASAATAVAIAVATSPADRVTFHVDRPFLFAVRDRKTGAVLFLGRIVDPSI